MKFPSRLSFRAWLIVPVLACSFIVGMSVIRIRQVVHVSELAGTPPAIDAASATGYSGGVRQLILPGRDPLSAQWILQTQQMLADGPARVRHVDYDNAPAGREVPSASAYRWWLGALAWAEHTLSSRPVGISVERAALFSDPLLHVILLVGLTIFVARRFGTLPAALVAVGFAAMFPLGGSFLAGQPADRGLVIGCVLGSVLPLVVTGASGSSEVSANRRFFFAGIVGGLGLWLDIQTQAPILAGIAVGGLGAGWIVHRSGASRPPAPWRMWAWGGATATLAMYLIEYSPSHLGGWRLDAVHPLYALGWVIGGELLARTVARPTAGSPRSVRGNIWAAAGPGLLLIALTVALGWTGWHGFLTPEPVAARLTSLPNAPVATNLSDWLSRNGLNAILLATCLPLVLLIPAVRLLVFQRTDVGDRSALAIALGPVVIALGFACVQLRWWNILDAALLALLAVAVSVSLRRARTPRTTQSLWSVAFALVLMPGLLLLVPRSKADVVTATEVEALIERDLAHWLAVRAGPEGATVLASPNLTTSLIYHGGVRGLGTLYRHNKGGLAAALRIAGTTAQDEAMALVERRKITHIVLASWDPFLAEYVRRTSNKPETSLMGLLQQWSPPRWLKPIPYTLPSIPGFEGHSVEVFEVVEVQDQVTALSRLAEYFLELRQADLAASVTKALEHSFPDDFVALVSRALIWSGLGHTDGFSSAFDRMLPLLETEANQDMLFDRRVSLAIVLTEGKRLDLARHQVQRCVEELDEMSLRSLTPLALYRLHLLLKAFNQPIVDPELKRLSLALLPVEMSSRL